MSMLRPADERAWDQPDLLNRSWTVPAMLSPDERTVIAYCASQLRRRHPCIVELGSYIGASTMALVDGLCARTDGKPPRKPVIHSYDLFQANAFMVDHSLAVHGIEAGGDFSAVFLSMLGDGAAHVEMHAGDIRQETWRRRRAIDLLFIDILWGWDINQHVMAQFYRPLRKQSLLIHQDFVYSFYPWLPCSMEWFVQRGAFSYQYFAPPSTVVFRKERALTADEVAFDFTTDLSAEQQIDLVEAAAARFDDYPRALLLLSICRHLVDLGRADEARAAFGRVEAEFGGAIVEHHLELMSDWMVGQGIPPQLGE